MCVCEQANILPEASQEINQYPNVLHRNILLQLKCVGRLFEVRFKGGIQFVGPPNETKNGAEFVQLQNRLKHLEP